MNDDLKKDFDARLRALIKNNGRVFGLEAQKEEGMELQQQPANPEHFRLPDDLQAIVDNAQRERNRERNREIVAEERARMDWDEGMRQQVEAAIPPPPPPPHEIPEGWGILGRKTGGATWLSSNSPTEELEALRAENKRLKAELAEIEE